MLGFRFGNVALGIDEDKETGLVEFTVGEALPDNKMKVRQRYENIYEAWAKVLEVTGKQYYLPTSIEKYL